MSISGLSSQKALLQCLLTVPSEDSFLFAVPGSASIPFPLLRRGLGFALDFSRGTGVQDYPKSMAQGKELQFDKGDMKIKSG